MPSMDLYSAPGTRGEQKVTTTCGKNNTILDIIGFLYSGPQIDSGTVSNTLFGVYLDLSIWGSVYKHVCLPMDQVFRVPQLLVQAAI